MRLLLFALAVAPAAQAQLVSTPYHAGMIRRQYVDSARKNWDGMAPRPLNTIVWYPADPATREDTITIGPPDQALFLVGTAARGAPIIGSPARFPLVLLSHGTGGSGLQMGWLGIALARQGYIVAAVDHHGNTGAEDHYDPRGFLLWWERATDLHRVLDRILADSLFGARVDRQHIGAAGFSLGGYTVTAIAGGRVDLSAFERFCHSAERDATCGGQAEFPDAEKVLDSLKQADPRIATSFAHAGDDYRDPRVTAVVAMAPAVVNAFDTTSLRSIRVPLLIVVGADDSTAPSHTNAERLAQLGRHTLLVTVPGEVGHYDFLNQCTAVGRQRLAALCGDPLGVNRGGVHDVVAARVHRFFASQWGN